MFRRQFLKSAVVLPVAIPGLAMVLSACGAGSSSDGGGSPAPQSGGDCSANGTSVSIGSNHGHGLAAISAGDVNSGTQKTYILSGGHAHAVTLSAADFAQLQANQGLVLQTDPDGTGHSHAITIDCV